MHVYILTKYAILGSRVGNASILTVVRIGRLFPTPWCTQQAAHRKQAIASIGAVQPATVSEWLNYIT
jgi:hypothetical protein